MTPFKLSFTIPHTLQRELHQCANCSVQCTTFLLYPHSCSYLQVQCLPLHVCVQEESAFWLHGRLGEGNLTLQYTLHKSVGQLKWILRYCSLFLDGLSFSLNIRAAWERWFPLLFVKGCFYRSDIVLNILRRRLFVRNIFEHIII